MITGSPVNVLDYGASTSASAAVNSAAIQAAIDATPSGGSILIPPGTYAVQYGVINFTRKSSISFTSGGSKYSAVLQASASAATSSTPLVDVSGCYGLYFEGIDFSGVSQSGIGIYIHRPISGLDAFSSDHKFVNCYFTQFDRGVQIGRLDVIESNNEDMKFYDCKWENCAIGYSQYYQNSLQNVLQNCSIWVCPIGVNLGGNGSQTGSLVIYNGNFSTHTTAAIYFEYPANLSVFGARCELMKSFIDQGSWASAAFPSWSIYDAILIGQTNKDYPVIKCNSAGFTAVNCQFGVYTDDKEWIESDYYYVKNVLINCKFNKPFNSGISPVGGPYYTVGGYPFGSAGEGQFQIIGCEYWDTGSSIYKPIADVNGCYWSLYQITTSATPNVTESNVWVVNNTTAPLTITSVTANEHQQFSLVNYTGSSSTTTIKNNATIKTKSGSDTVLTAGMTFINVNGVVYEI